MFRKAALILMACASLLAGEVGAIEPGFRNINGIPITKIPWPVTILSLSGHSLKGSWAGNFGSESRSYSFKHVVTFYLTPKTVFGGGRRAKLSKGRKVHITYHFEGERAIADTITFVH